ncbi:AMP-binding protein [Salicibibacter cibarius]|uniref:AMP-binding protein n=1 Tax=Salicibibacter cibarius TaxID=2743000 RepID=A0A7T6Z6F3_9BACI|nr:AMP-binding protein [Salicibibacter cibarius]QQK77677.1 AMP-binding protein [Salicibibacter cibarius]
MTREEIPTWPQSFIDYYIEQGCWEGETFGDILSRLNNLYQEKIAVKDHTSALSYRALDERVHQLASGLLYLGIQPQDRVIIQLPNSIAFVEIIFALFRIGALPVFTLPAHRWSELSYIAEKSEAVAYVVPDQYDGFGYLPLARTINKNIESIQNVIVVGEEAEFTNYHSLFMETQPMPAVSADSVAFLQLSGGSTGLPKLIPRTHNDYIYSLKKSNEICQMTTASIYLAVLPAAHNFTLSSPGILGTLLAGGKVILSPSGSPEVAFPLMEKERVTITGLVPHLALLWLDAAPRRSFDFSSLEVMQVGGAKFGSEAAKRVTPTFNCTLQQVFGMAEGLVNYTRLDDPAEVIIHTQGRPMSEYDEILVVNANDEPVGVNQPGELLTRGPYTIRGYYKAQEHNKKAFTENGFYRTGDIVCVDEHGYITVTGREKDQINRGGEKIAAEEVENHLIAHEQIFDAAIVSMPDAFLGEKSCAYMISKSEEMDDSELRTYLRDRGMAVYKIPDRFIWVNEFPQSGVGKTSKKDLREAIKEFYNTNL